ncbi:MAG TPA: hypothetical protein PKN32_00935 [Bacteroidales bacterium]|nr:hypothetical protein [Bacteroidales bacterium]
MDDNIKHNWETFHETYENKLKGKDFENCKKIILKFGPEVYKRYNQQQIKPFYFKFFSNIADKSNPALFKFLAESIVNLYSNGDISDDTGFTFLLKMQLIISLIQIDYDCIDNSPIDKDSYNAFIYSLFEESIKNEINNKDELVKKSIFRYTSSNINRNKKDTDVNIDAVSQEIAVLQKIDVKNNKRAKGPYKNDFTSTSKQKCLDWYLENTQEILDDIIHDTYEKFKYDVISGKLKFCNKSAIELRFLNASKRIFSIELTHFNQLNDIHLNQKHHEDSDDKENDISNESTMLKTYALMLIPDSFRVLILNYYKYGYNVESVATRNIIHRWSKENISIFKKAFNYFVPIEIQTEILSNYIRNITVNEHHLSSVLSLDTPCAIEIENSCFLYWKLLADKLISYNQSENISHKYCYDCLNRWFIYKKKTETPSNQEEIPSFAEVLHDWFFFVSITDSLVKIFIKCTDKNKLLIVLKKMRKLEEKQILDYLVADGQFDFNTVELESIIKFWDNARTKLRSKLQNFDELQRNIIIFAIGAKYSKEKIADCVYEKCNYRADEREIISKINIWDELVANFGIK